jgi:hypothetical protein
MMIRSSILLLVTLLFSSIAYSGDWQQWRGPFSNGSADEQGLVSDLNDPQNTLWTVEMPGVSAGTPIISKSKAFVIATGDKFKLISTRDFNEGVSRASIAIANGRVFVRTGQKLHCFAAK